MKSVYYPDFSTFWITLLFTGFLFSFIFLMPNVYGQDRLNNARESMVKHQIEEQGIHDKATLTAMRKVPRHLFVPVDQQKDAYQDSPLPIGYGQTISQPYMVAYMTQSIHPCKGMKVLEIGTGSGYQAAILAEIVDSVFTIEIVKPLGEKSADLLHSLGYNNVKVSIGDGFAGWPEHGPYDGIIVTAAAEDVPPPLIAQLKEGGLLIIPLGKPGGVQTLVLGYKEKGKFIKKDLMFVRFVPFVRE
ncbi:MAG: protein-L-isoaspartate(D-aspartate) O-methyltransferase [Lentimicrobium sp.]|jgi:protein-L-isoaspartate(D-aspartate) O-methyltransferase|nr:protein-L-isoaspartate(D-aspartate) O-methyltransferase [Lentimicrobium sp.]